MMLRLVEIGSWTLLIFILSLTTFGFTFILLTLSSIIVFLAGLYLALHVHMQECLSNGSNNCYSNIIALNIYPTRKFVYLLTQQNQQQQPFDPNSIKPSLVRWDSLSGDPIIDEQLREIIELLFRDIVVPWFSSISDRDDVIDDLKNIINTVVRNITSRYKIVFSFVYHNLFCIFL